MVQAKDVGAPHQFLYKRFPNWKDDQKTHMIPPVFTPKTVQVAIEGPVLYSDRGELGESIVYNRLMELGEKKKIGMFVINGFHLKDVGKWNKRCTPDYQVPDIRSGNVHEFDFVIFHHTLGVIAVEVKNDLNVRNNNILSAEKQLKMSHDFVQQFAAFDMNPKLMSFFLTGKSLQCHPPRNQHLTEELSIAYKMTPFFYLKMT